VPAGQSAPYAVTYRPMAMTPQGEAHAGSVFFPLPDGSALMYTLKGTAGPPQEASYTYRYIDIDIDISRARWGRRRRRAIYR